MDEKAYPYGPFNFRIGDRVRLRGYGRPLDDHKTFTVEDVDPMPDTRCQSGLLVKLVGYPGWLDYAWLYQI